MSDLFLLRSVSKPANSNVINSSLMDPTRIKLLELFIKKYTKGKEDDLELIGYWFLSGGAASDIPYEYIAKTPVPQIVYTAIMEANLKPKNLASAMLILTYFVSKSSPLAHVFITKEFIEAIVESMTFPHPDVAYNAILSLTELRVYHQESHQYLDEAAILNILLGLAKGGVNGKVTSGASFALAVFTPDELLNNTIDAMVSACTMDQQLTTARTLMGLSYRATLYQSIAFINNPKIIEILSIAVSSKLYSNVFDFLTNVSYIAPQIFASKPIYDLILQCFSTDEPFSKEFLGATCVLFGSILIASTADELLTIIRAVERLGNTNIGMILNQQSFVSFIKAVFLRSGSEFFTSFTQNNGIGIIGTLLVSSDDDNTADLLESMLFAARKNPDLIQFIHSEEIEDAIESIVSKDNVSPKIVDLFNELNSLE